MANRLYIKAKEYLSPRISTREEKHQLIVFLLATLTGLVGFPLHIIGVWGSDDEVLQLISIANWIGLAIVLLLYLCKKVNLFTAFTWYGIVMQAMLSAKIVYIACTMPQDASYLILFNSFTSMLVILVLVMGYMRSIPFFITILSLATSVVVRIVAPQMIQMQFMLYFLFIEIFACALGFMAWRDLHEVENENVDYHNEVDSILKTLHIDNAELKALLAMSVEENPSVGDIESIFSHLDERAERNILTAVRKHDAEIRLQNLEIAKVFPMLSQTEQEVCRLVLKGKTLAEIADALGKNANNISSVRIHIRRKLGLKQGEDLKNMLMKKLILLLLIFLPSLAKAQYEFKEEDSNRWLMVSPDSQQVKEDSMELPTAYFYNIPNNFCVELYDFPKSNPILQITTNAEDRFFEDSVVVLQSEMALIYCNIPYSISNAENEVIKKGMLTLRVNANNIQQLYYSNELNPTAHYICEYLLNNEGSLSISIPILAQEKKVLKIPCIEGRAQPFNKIKF